MSSHSILVADEGRVRTLTLNRPAQRNAMSSAAFDALRHALSAAALDRAVHCVVLAGAAGTFCAGLDLNDFANNPVPDDGERHGFVPCIEEIERFPKPLLAAVSGTAVGFGATVLAHCDLVVAADSASFRFPFVQLGLAPEAGSSVLLPELIGPQAAAHLLFTGEWIDAAAAAELGLVWKVVDEEALSSTVRSLAAGIAEGSIESLVATKKLLLAGRLEAVRAARARELDSYSRLLHSDAFRRASEKFRVRKASAT
jgi:enoyl-CoA hydratase/carnithine racemase